MRPNRIRGAIHAVIACALLAGVASFAAPAAADAPTITFTDCISPTPTPDPEGETGVTCTPRRESVVSGKITPAFEVQVEAFHDTRVELYVLIAEPGDDEAPDPGDPEPGDPVRSWNFSAGANGQTWRHPQSVPDPFTWDTRTLSPYNGKYEIKVRATSEGPTHGGMSAEEARGELFVDYPPERPGAPKVVVATSDGVSLRWGEAPEPDVKSYTLFRARTDSSEQKPKDGDFKRVATVSETEHFDETPSGGAFWYKLRVNRNSEVHASGLISSALSPRSGAGVVNRPTPQPEATPANGGGNGGGDGGGGDGSVRTDPITRVTPRPVSSQDRPPPVDNAPFSAQLPYEDRPDRDQALSDPSPTSSDDEEGQDRGAVPAIAMGMFLVSAALALGRMPT